MNTPSPELLYELALDEGFTEQQIKDGEVYYVWGFGDDCGNMKASRRGFKITKPEEEIEA
jgi:hypothetical protein